MRELSDEELLREFESEVGCQMPEPVEEQNARRRLILQRMKGPVTIKLGVDDALLLQASLRQYRWTFQEAGNEVMTGLLDRVEEALEKAQKESR